MFFALLFLNDFVYDMNSQTYSRMRSSKAKEAPANKGTNPVNVLLNPNALPL